MRKLLLTLSAALLLSVPLQADSLFVRPARGEHFFPPPRTLFHFRPDFFVYGHPFPYFPRWSPYYYAYPVMPLMPPAPRGIYAVSIPSPEPSNVVRVNAADLVFRVTPGRARVYINDRVIGPASAFSTQRAGYAPLDDEYSIRIECPGHKPFETILQVAPDHTLEIDVELEPAAES